MYLSLFDFGYIHSIPVKKGKTANIGPLCHYFDILIDKQDSNLVTPSKCFLKQFTANKSDKSNVLDATVIAEQHLFVKNDDKKSYLVQEFIKTERNYVSSLDSFIKFIVNPLRSKSKDRHQAILGIYECNQIFMNIEELYKVNAAFNENLRKINHIRIGQLFNKHLDYFKCYKKFLSGVSNARLFHTKEFKNNVLYLAFLNKLSEGTPTVYDYLLLPGQRLGHYKMFLKEIIKHTPGNDQDFKHLFEALRKIEEMASMADDYHTKLIHIFQNMLQSIQNCPASIISQQRSLICHIDATEYELHTLKPLNPVSIFLFTDKIMVVRRPSYDVDGLELCGLDQEKDDLGMVSLLIRKGGANKRPDRKLKFRGWLGLSDAEIYEGVPELISSFILVSTTSNNNNSNSNNNSNNNNISNASSGPSSPEVDQVLENYFQEERAHLFSLYPPSTDNSLLNSPPSPSLSSTPSSYVLSQRKSVQSLNSNFTTSSINYLDKRDDFIKQFGNTKMKLKTKDLSTVYYQWKDHHFYGNVYDINYYHTSINKNESAVIFIGDNSADFNTIFGECYVLPYTLFIVSPTIGSNYSIFIQGKMPVEHEEPNEDYIQELLVNEINNNEVTEQLLTNVIYCDKELYSVMRMASPSSPVPSSQSSTKSVRDTIKQLNRRKSISTFNKILSGSVQNNFAKPPSPPRIQQQRPKSTTFNQESSVMPPHTFNQDDKRSNIKHTLTESKNKSDFVTPSSSFLNHRANAIKHQKTSSHSDLLSRKTPSPVQGNSSNSNDIVASSYRPSVHPSQTMSYEIKPQSRLNLNNNKSADNHKTDSIEEQVHLLCAALAQGVDVSSNNINTNNNYSNNLNSRYEFQTKHQSILPYHINSSSAAFLGSGSITGSTSSPLFNLGNARRNSIPLSQEPIIPSKTGESTMLSKIKNNNIIDKQQQIIPSTSPSPASLSSLSSSSSPTSITLESLVNEMEQMKTDFDKRLSRIVDDYEKTSIIVQQLTSQLKMKDEELIATKTKYEETVKENGQLYDAFKSELESIIFLVNQRDIEAYNNSNDGNDIQINIKQTEETYSTSYNSFFNIHLRKKLELALKERNQWHQTACQLARELQDITMGLNNGHIDSRMNEGNTTSTHITEESLYNHNNDNNNDIDSSILNKQKIQQNHEVQQLRIDHIVSSISTPMNFTSQHNYKNNHP
ncbi:unnamed protein product [Cunninghamella blakesleeana]